MRIAGVLLTLLMISIDAVCQQAPMAVYPGPERTDEAKEPKQSPPGFSIDEKRPKPYRLLSLSPQETRRNANKHLPQKGISRAVPAPASRAATVVMLPDGRRVWRVTIASPAASGLRIHFRRFAVGAGHVWVYAPAQNVSVPVFDGPFTGRGPFDDGEFWTGVVNGDSVTIEYADATPDSRLVLPPFQIDSVLHIWDESVQMPESPPGLLALAGRLITRLLRPHSLVSAFGAITPPWVQYADAALQDAAYCELDVACYSDYQNMSKGVVQFEYVGDDGAYYVCSGSMVNTRASSFKPYLLTAHHCIGSEPEARSIIAHFFYQDATCNAPPPALSAVPSVSGGHYLAGAPISQGDYSFVLLNQDVPGGTWFLGWNLGGLNVGDPAVGIHHPQGSWKRISFGNRLSDETINFGGEIGPAGLYYQIGWNQGKTEAGSSGSPLLNSQGQILGTLTGGPILAPGATVCDIANEGATYGRFSNAYSALSSFLNDTPPPSLNVTPASMVFTVKNGQYSGPSQQVFTISTSSTTALSYSLNSSVPWIKLSSLSGSVSASGAASITVSIDPLFFSKTTITRGTVSVSSGTLTLIISVQANVAVSLSKVVVSVTPNPVYQQNPDSDGYSWFVSVMLIETGGVNTTVTGFKIAGNDYSSNIVSWFGSNQLPAGGTLSANLRTRDLTVPVGRVFEADGVDSGTSRTWAALVTVPFLGRPTSAVLTMDSAPNLIRQNPNSSDCPWYQQLVLQETGGLSVTLSQFVAGGSDLSNQIASWWGSTQLPANGSLRAGLCWPSIQTPNTLSTQVSGTDSTGKSVSASTSGYFTGPAASPTTMSAVPVSAVLSSPVGATAPVTSLVSLNFGSSSTGWSGRLIFPQVPKTWLTVSPLSGTGSTNLTVTASPGGLVQGSYAATLVLQSTDAIPELINIPVKLSIGAAATAPLINPVGIVNTATYLPGAAPGSTISVFGQHLASGIQLASALPLPISMQGVTAAVNGRSTPFYYASPTQLNLQVPYETEIGLATLTVTLNGQNASQQFQVSNTAPGIFTSDGRNIVPINQASRGDYGVLFITGQGVVSPKIATGAAPSPDVPLQNLPVPLAAVGVTVGGFPAIITFDGIPYGLTGVMQINYQIPTQVPTGIQPVVVQVGDKFSPAAYINVTLNPPVSCKTSC